MLFNSLHFLLFFIIVTSLYFALPHNRRWLLLLISSCYFYMAFVPIYIIILGGTIVIDYFAGIFIEKSKGKRRKLFLVASLVANIGVLAVFKYYNFINENLSFLLHGFGASNPIPYLSILLPVGLSFHTFQAMSYTIEVYRGHQKAERHFGIYSLYVMFYPQLVAGPIERPQNMLHQFREKYDFDYDRVMSGLRLMAWGLFKKVVIADRLAIAVDTVFNNPEQHNSLSLIIATVFFTFQIFCDFSGYSDMALGAARIMGFKLMTNFDKPYQSKSVHEFWKRWHISLSTWFKDYLYITLGGNRVTVPRWYLNLFIVFLVSGLWHGANWTFVIWGALHGFYLVFGLITQKYRDRFNQLLRIDKVPIISTISTFVLVAFAWIFFRANSVDSAFYIVKHIFTGIPDVVHQLINNQPVLESMGLKKNDFALSILLIIFLETVHYVQSKKSLSDIFVQKPAYVRWAVYYGVILAIIFLGVFENRQFIYFQF
ncbi:MBOAT family O-acyltransferase [Alistipes sp. ZOR0009]|uniref:MBOAT family O-acyltransferase n=1 Tax=Alistipes sp. ZOR0009 TaxID=1339253 RepID=UPI0006461B31|nr:MBOAT family O-acyltransferase [Alistipes sp. ZOR0009]